VTPSHRSMSLDLSDEQTGVLTRERANTTGSDLYPFSERVSTLKAVGSRAANFLRCSLFGSARFQVAQEPIEALLIFRRLLPLPEVADVALVPQLDRPRFGRGNHCVVDADRE